MPWGPFHPHLEPEPVVPGEISEYAIELAPIANVFRAGHRLRLSIHALDHAHWPPADLELGAGHVPWHVARNATVTHLIHHGPSLPSRLLLPVVDD
jgi:predicted acyl esterase